MSRNRRSFIRLNFYTKIKGCFRVENVSEMQPFGCGEMKKRRPGYLIRRQSLSHMLASGRSFTHVS